MSGYEYHHLVRITPTNGAARVLDLREELHEAGGPVSTRVEYDEEVERYDDVNRRMQQNVFGVRVSGRLVCEIGDIADQAALAEIVRASLLGDKVELSLDGGFVYREIHLDGRLPSPQALAGKTFVGARFELRWSCRDLLRAEDFPIMSAEGGW